MDHNGPLIMSFLESFHLSIKGEVFYDCNKIVIWWVFYSPRSRFGQDMYIQDHKRWDVNWRKIVFS